MFKFIIILIFILSSCATPNVQSLNPEVYYKQDICVTYKRDLSTHGEIGTWYRNKVKRKFKLFRRDKLYQEIYMCGIGVLPESDKYSLEINHTASLNFFIVNTCHREITAENPDSGLFMKNGKMTLDYTPTVEKGKACPLYLAAYNNKGRNGWATLAFESSEHQLKAKVKCNGDEIDFNGTSICQSHEGTIQSIEFEEEVMAIEPVNGPAERKEDCPTLTSKDGKKFDFRLPNRECYYGFIGKKSLKSHKFYTIGYEQVIIREI